MKLRNIIILISFVFFVGCEKYSSDKSSKLNFKAEKKYKNIDFTLIYNKNLDLIVLNSLEEEGAGFGHDTNKVTIFNKNGEKVETNLKSKIDIAHDIASEIIKYSNF